MKFADRPSLQSCYKEAVKANIDVEEKTYEEFSLRILNEAWDQHESMLNGDRKAAATLISHRMSQACQGRAERQWCDNHRPYYDLYPNIVPMLENTRLDIDSEHVVLPLNEVLIRLPVEGIPLPSGGRLYSLFLSKYFQDDDFPEFHPGKNGLQVWADIGMRSVMFSGLETRSRMNNFNRMCVPLEAGVTVEEGIANENWNNEETAMSPGVRGAFDSFTGKELVLNAADYRYFVRLIVGCILLSQNPEFFVRQVLKQDENKPVTDKILDRAKRRGKYGWSIGAEIEICPHFRRPHFSIRWKRINPKPAPLTPVLVPVKGCVVKRKNLTSMPTGYLDDSEGNDE